MRGSYSGNTLAFQAKAESSILLPRSTQCQRDLVVRLLSSRKMFITYPCSLVVKHPAYIRHKSPEAVDQSGSLAVGPIVIEFFAA